MLADFSLLVAFLCIGFALGALVIGGFAWDKGFREGEMHGRKLARNHIDWPEEALR